MKRNRATIAVLAVALLLVWALDESDEGQATAVVCQSDVLPGHADPIYALALRDARLGDECGPTPSIDEGTAWGSVPHSAYVARHLDDYLFASN